MKRWNTLVVVFCLTVVVIASAAAINAHKKIGPSDQTEAPTGFTTPTLTDNPGTQSTSNGLVEAPGDTFAEDQEAFEEEDGIDKGLGPVYNARSCADSALSSKVLSSGVM